MPRLFTTIVTLAICSFSLNAQNIDFILKKSPTEYTDFYDTTKIKLNQSLVHLKHSSSKIENPGIFDTLQFEVVYSIQLVYTEPDKKVYDQERLNRRRLQELKKVAPYLIENNLISWSFLEQRKSDTRDSEGLFHGYVITKRPSLSGKNGLTEFQVLERLVKESKSLCDSSLYEDQIAILPSTKDENGKPIKTAPKDEPQFPGGNNKFFDYLRQEIPYTKKMFKESVSGEANVSIYFNHNGELSKIKFNKSPNKECRELVRKALRKMPKWLPGVAWTKGSNARKYLVGGSYKLSLFFSMEQKKLYVKYLYFQGKYVEESLQQTLSNLYLPIEVLCDSTVFKALERNKQWKKKSIVADLTCSMYPYTNQLVMWFKLNPAYGDAENYLTFFNDGDGIPNNQKVVGKVGGIYQGKASSFEDVVDLAEVTMTCCSGDIIENNIESAIAALEKFPEADELVMIADNYATPRDLSLLRKVKKPIRLILCGTHYGINVDYLNLLRKNGGSLHTMTNDLTDLIKLKEGETLVYGDRKFKIVNGEFQELYDL